MQSQRAYDWLNQAEQDFLWASDSLATKHYYGVCFLAQQIAKKSLKSIAIFREYDQVKSHSVVNICGALKINGDLEANARILDQYYIPTRYPDGLPAGNAAMFFTKEQATQALELCRVFMEYAHKEIGA